MSDLGLSGVFTGIDWDIIVAHSMAAARRPLEQLESRKDVWESKATAVGEIESRLNDLRDLVGALRNASDLRAAVASTSNSDVAYATASEGAGEGTFQIEVNQLAAAEREIHAGVAPTEAWTNNKSVSTIDDEYISSDDISDNTGDNYKFVFQFGSESQVSVDLSSYAATGITLNQLVGEINTAAGYTAASAVNDDGQYHLRIQAQSAGSGKDLTITDDDSIDLLDSTSDFTQTVDGDVGTETLIGAGSFVYTYNGVTRTIVTTASSTLGQLRDLINNDSSNPGVTATILEYEVDQNHVYHLVLTGGDTGEDYAITIESDTTLSGFGPGANWTEQAARNAQIRVDGYPSGTWIEKSSNSITDVIPNVTLNLTGTGTGSDAVTITLARDTNGLENDLQNLVNIYNGIVDVMAEYTDYNEDTGKAGILQGDILVNTIRSQIREPLIGTVTGFLGTTDTYTLASQLGIEIDSDGHLELDTDTLGDALEADYQAVLALIGAAGSGGSDNSFIQFNSAHSSTTAGIYEVEIDYDGSGNITAARIRTKGESEWRTATVEGDIIRGSDGSPEQYLELQGIWDSSKAGSSYTESGEVRVQQGFAGAIYDRLDDILDVVDGTIATKKDRIDSAIEIIDKQIDVQQRRLEQKEEQLRAKYTRLEATLARLDSMSSQVSALVTTLASMNSATSSARSN